MKHTFSRKLTAKAIVDAYDNALRDWQDTVTADRFQAVKAGVTELPKGFYSKDNEQAATARVYAHMHAALDKIAEQKEAVKDRLTEPPSYEAAAYAAAIAARNDMTREEITAGLDHYKDHLTQRAIFAAAKRSGLIDTIGKTEAEQYGEDLDYMAEQVQRFICPLNISQAAGTEGRQIIERSVLEGIAQPNADAASLFMNMIENGTNGEPPAALFTE